MEQRQRNQLSKFMSLILRHKPSEYGVSLDNEGYITISTLQEAINKSKGSTKISKENILEVVRECPKQRYEIKGELIRASYGHSAKRLPYAEKTPPATLIHGTHKGVLESILKTGIKKMNREFVHLSETTHFATLAGQRRGDVVYIKVDTKKALALNVKFYYVSGEVWLSEDIPPTCLTVLEDK